MEAESLPSSCCGSPKKMRGWLPRKLLEHSLEFGLVVASAVALAWPDPGDDLSQHKVGSFHIAQTVNICTFFATSGLLLDTRDTISAIMAFRSVAYGLLAILVVTPTLGFGIVMLPFDPMEFAPGLAIFMAMPTTLSGVAMVDKAQGNTALAQVLAICSTLAGVATAPFLINLITVHGSDVHIDMLPLLIKLLSTVLLPLVLGMGLRELLPWLRRLSKAQSWVLDLVANINIALLAWQMLSRSQDQILEPHRTMEVGIIIAAAAGVHILYLVSNVIAATATRLPFQEKKAVVLMASQKSLPVALAVLSFLKEPIWDQGLLAVACIMAHMAQVLVDLVIVARWASMGDGPAELESVVTGSGRFLDGSPLKGDIKVVDNPLAAMDPPRNGMDKGSCGTVAELDDDEPVDSPEGRRSLQAISMSHSSEDSFVSARTVFSNGGANSARGGPQGEP